jgi:hypothetical protein
MGNFVYAGYFLFMALDRRVKKVITIHSGSFIQNVDSMVFVKRYLITRLLKRFDHIIVVNEEMRDFLSSYIASENRVSVIPAFLPPTIEAVPVIKRDVDSLRRKVSKVFLLSGSGLPYYGYHIMLDALGSSDELKKETGTIFAFYNDIDEDYVKKLKARLGSYNLVVYKDLSHGHFAYLLSLVDIYVRATDRDGDAIVIREAGYFGKQVIASDCVQRPDNILLFKTMDATSLRLKMEHAVKDYQIGIARFDFNEYKDKCIQLYKRLLHG